MVETESDVTRIEQTLIPLRILIFMGYLKCLFDLFEIMKETNYYINITEIFLTRLETFGIEIHTNNLLDNIKSEQS